MPPRVGFTIILGLLFCLSSQAYSGDYELTISDDPSAPCASKSAYRNSLNNPIRTSAEVTEDIYRYFHGEKPELPLFVAAFGNAHIRFCGQKEKQEIQRALISVAKQSIIENEGHLFDYIYMLGDKSTIEMIKEELRANNPSKTKRRLERAQKAVMKRYQQGNK